MKESLRAEQRRRLPVVLSVAETQRLLGQFEGTMSLIIRVLYGGGLRVIETARLRVQDIDFDQGLIFIRGGKGDKDRSTVLPETLIPELREHINRVEELHKIDLSDGFGRVWLPGALAKKYPQAAGELGWQWLFPSASRSVDPENGVVRRYHVSVRTIQKAFKAALRNSGIVKHASVHTLPAAQLRHSLTPGRC
jgi:integrase